MIDIACFSVSKKPSSSRCFLCCLELSVNNRSNYSFSFAVSGRCLCKEQRGVMHFEPFLIWPEEKQNEKFISQAEAAAFCG